MHIIGLSGSLRERSFNRALLRAAIDLAPADCEIRMGDIRGIPLYDGDEEAANGIPEPVAILKDRIAEADALLLVTPEYNQSIPGVFKNAIDWLSRPPADIARVFGGKPVGLMGASPGRLGTVNAQSAWLPVWRGLGVVPFLGKSCFVSGANQVFDADLRLTDETVKKVVSGYVEAFVAFVRDR